MKHLKKYKIFESTSKFSDEFINIIRDICLELKDSDYTVDISESMYNLINGSDRAFNSLNKGDKVLTDCLEIKVKSPDLVGGRWLEINTDILYPIIETIIDVSSDFNFLVDIYIPYEGYIEAENIKEKEKEIDNILSILIYQR